MPTTGNVDHVTNPADNVAVVKITVATTVTKDLSYTTDSVSTHVQKDTMLTLTVLVPLVTLPVEIASDQLMTNVFLVTLHYTSLTTNVSLLAHMDIIPIKA